MSSLTVDQKRRLKPCPDCGILPDPKTVEKSTGRINCASCGYGPWYWQKTDFELEKERPK